MGKFPSYNREKNTDAGQGKVVDALSSAEPGEGTRAVFSAGPDGTPKGAEFYSLGN